MLRTRWCAGMVILAVAGLPLAVRAAEGDAKNDKKDMTPEPPKERLIPAGSMTGEVTKVDDGGKSFTLQLKGKVPQVTGYDKYGRPQFSPMDATQDIPVTLTDDTKIRVPPKPEVDPKTGRLKPVVIRKDPNDPDRNLPGVKGAPADLAYGQLVTVSFGMTREKPRKTHPTVILILGNAPKQ